MAGIFPYALYSQPKNDINFNGGLNSTSGPLSLKDIESSDLSNIDFNKFGSILKRNGYAVLNSVPLGPNYLSDQQGFIILDQNGKGVLQQGG